VAFRYQLHHFAPLRCFERRHAARRKFVPPDRVLVLLAVQNQDLHTAQLAHQSAIATIEMGDGEISRKLGRTRGEDRAVSFTLFAAGDYSKC
jgi:hypothetical protein